MSKKVKVSDVRQGVTLYYVHAFPHKGADRSYIETVQVACKPFTSKYTDSLFAMGNFIFEDDLSSYNRQFSLRDAGIIPNPYNFHKAFTNLNTAERYAKRMDRQCLTFAERAKAKRKNQEDYDMRAFHA